MAAKLISEEIQEPQPRRAKLVSEELVQPSKAKLISEELHIPKRAKLISEEVYTAPSAPTVIPQTQPEGPPEPSIRAGNWRSGTLDESPFMSVLRYPQRKLFDIISTFRGKKTDQYDVLRGIKEALPNSSGNREGNLANEFPIPKSPSIDLKDSVARPRAEEELDSAEKVVADLATDPLLFAEAPLNAAGKGLSFLNKFKNIQKVTKPVEKAYQYIFGGAHGVLSVDQPKLAEAITWLENRLQGTEGMTNESMTKIAKVLAPMPEASRNKILDALLNEKKLRGMKVEQISPTLQRTKIEPKTFDEMKGEALDKALGTFPRSTNMPQDAARAVKLKDGEVIDVPEDFKGDHADLINSLGLDPDEVHSIGWVQNGKYTPKPFGKEVVPEKTGKNIANALQDLNRVVNEMKNDPANKLNLNIIDAVAKGDFKSRRLPENFKELVEARKRVDAIRSGDVSQVDDVLGSLVDKPGYGTKPIEQVATKDQQIQINAQMEKKLFEKQPSGLITDVPKDTQYYKDRALEAERALETHYDEMIQGGIDKKTLRSVVKGEVDQKLLQGDLLRLRQLKNDSTIAEQNYLKSKAGLDVGGAGTSPKYDHGKDVYEAITTGPEGVKKWLIKATKTDPLIKLNPVEQKIYGKLRTFSTEISENLSHMPIVNPAAANLPTIEEGAQRSRYYGAKSPLNMTVPPKGGWIIDQNTGHVISVERVNSDRVAKGLKPLSSDLEILYSVGLKESREAKLVNEWLNELPKKFGKNFKMMEAPGLPGTAKGFSREGLLADHDIFTAEELKRLPGSFSNKQFPQELVDYVRRGSETSRDPINTFGPVWAEYMNSFKGWAMASPRALWRNQGRNLWNIWGAGGNIPETIGPAKDILMGKEGSTTLANGRKLSYKAILQAAKERDVPTGFFRGDIPGFQTPAKFEDKINTWQKTLGSKNPVSESFMSGYSAMEAHSRMMLFLDRVQKYNGNYDKAASYVSHWLIDYKDLSPVQRRLKDVFLFPTGYVKNVPLQIEMMVKRPDKFALLNHVYNALDQLGDGGPTPEWMKDKWRLQGPDGRYYMAGDYIGANQLEDFLAPFARMAQGGARPKTEAAFGVARGMLGGMNPLLIGLVESTTGKELMNGYDIENYPIFGKETKIMGVPVESKYLPMLKSIPGLGRLLLEGQGWQKKSELPFKKERSIPQKLLDLGIIKGYDVQPNKELRSGAMELSEGAKQFQMQMKAIAQSKDSRTKEMAIENFKKEMELRKRRVQR